MSSQVITSYKDLDRQVAAVALDYHGTIKLFKKMISEWKEAADGRSLFELEGNVGHILNDFGAILGMRSDELYDLLR